jgi:hypothetical protein
MCSHESQSIYRSGQTRSEADRRAPARAIHDHKLCTSEGETWELDFSPELKEIDEALQMAGIDTTQPLHAPIRWRDRDGDEDDA